jgi:hypothetical protein
VQRLKQNTTYNGFDSSRLSLLVCSLLVKASSRRFGELVNYWGTRIPFCPAMRLSPAFKIDHGS